MVDRSAGGHCRDTEQFIQLIHGISCHGNSSSTYSLCPWTIMKFQASLPSKQHSFRGGSVTHHAVEVPIPLLPLVFVVGIHGDLCSFRRFSVNYSYSSLFHWMFFHAAYTVHVWLLRELCVLKVVQGQRLLVHSERIAVIGPLLAQELWVIQFRR